MSVTEYEKWQLLYVVQRKYCTCFDWKNVVCHTNKENLQFMINRSEVFAYGTFQYEPKKFYQLYTIHWYKNRFFAK